MPRLASATPAVRLLAFETPDGLVRLLVGNEAHVYVLARIDMRRPVREVRVASHFPGRPIDIADSILNVRIPPRGVVLLDVAPKIVYTRLTTNRLCLKIPSLSVCSPRD